MLTRILLLSILTSFAATLAIAGEQWHEPGVQIMLLLLTGLGMILISETIRNYKWLEIRSNVLVITQTFGRVRSIKLDEVSSWTEKSFYLRGQLRKNLILFLPQDETLIISMYDDRLVFEKVLDYLKADHSKLKERKMPVKPGDS